ncbi:hypothetical protein D3C81_1460010 [compost metagenome]
MLRPMRDHQYTGTVGDQNHRAFDLLQLVLDRPHTGHAIEFVGFQWRNTAHFAQPGFKQRLPMFGNVVTQTRDDQNGSASLQFVHVNTFIFR